MARALGSSREPDEWQQATAQARAARMKVGQQLSELLAMADVTGSRDVIEVRARQLGAELRRGDIVLIRAASIELGVASGAFAAAIDLRQISG